MDAATGDIDPDQPLVPVILDRTFPHDIMGREGKPDVHIGLRTNPLTGKMWDSYTHFKQNLSYRFGGEAWNRSAVRVWSGTPSGRSRGTFEKRT